MNLLSWCLSLALLITILVEAMNFQHGLICRQKAWLKATELKTRTLLFRPVDAESAPIPGCMILVSRNPKNLGWRKLSGPYREFSLPLRGRL